jgi:hypothetical protein
MLWDWVYYTIGIEHSVIPSVFSSEVNSLIVPYKRNEKPHGSMIQISGMSPIL